MKRTTLMIAAVVALGSLAACNARPDARNDDKAAAQTAADTKTVTFAVESMTCATCPITVRKAMEKVDGVQSVAVSFEARTATVVFDPAVATPQQIGAASTRAGYPADPSADG